MKRHFAGERGALTAVRLVAGVRNLGEEPLGLVEEGGAREAVRHPEVEVRSAGGQGLAQAEERVDDEVLHARGPQHRAGALHELERCLVALGQQQVGDGVHRRERGVRRRDGCRAELGSVDVRSPELRGRSLGEDGLAHEVVHHHAVALGIDQEPLRELSDRALEGGHRGAEPGDREHHEDAARGVAELVERDGFARAWRPEHGAPQVVWAAMGPRDDGADVPAVARRVLVEGSDHLGGRAIVEGAQRGDHGRRSSRRERHLPPRRDEDAALLHSTRQVADRVADDRSRQVVGVVDEEQVGAGLEQIHDPREPPLTRLWASRRAEHPEQLGQGTGGLGAGVQLEVDRAGVRPSRRCAQLVDEPEHELGLPDPTDSVHEEADLGLEEPEGTIELGSPTDEGAYRAREHPVDVITSPVGGRGARPTPRGERPR